MALVLKDRVKETTTTTGTGTLTLAGAMSGFQAFSVIGNANTTYYAIYEPSGTAWEVGIGTYTLAGTTLSRDTILASSNAGAAVNFGAGTKVVFCTYPAGKSVYLDAAGAASVNINGTVGATTPTTGAFTTISATGVVTVSAGAVGAPSIVSTTGTADTGQWFPAADTIAWSTAGAERMRIDSVGSVGIGATSLTGYNLKISKALTGATGARGVEVDSVVQSDVTVVAYGYRSSLGTQAAAFTCANLRHYEAFQGTFGASSTVTTQTGFWVDSTLTGATNNYGFRGGIATGTNRYNLYMDGTAVNYMAGSLGIGSTSLTGVNLMVNKNITGAVTSQGIFSQGAVQSDVTSNARYFQSTASTQDAVFTLANLAHYSAFQGTFGASSTVTNQYGFSVASSLTGATNNIAFYSDIASGTGRWNFYAAGTANNYMAGSLGIGATSLTGYSLKITKNITGAVSSFGIVNDGQIQSDVTTSVYGYRTALAVQNAAFTLPNLYHVSVEQGTYGASATVTNQYGVIIGSNLTGATNNYGFYGNIPSGTGRWNFYAAGTAANYFAGSVGIGSVSLSDVNLAINKNITGAVTAYGMYSLGAIQSDVTSDARYFSTFATTQAASFTLTSLKHYAATQGTFGASSVVTDQYGFHVASNLVNATNNYGFYGNIASGSGRWNFYAAGTAANFFGGTVTIQTASATALTVGLNGSTNPAFTVDSSTASQAAGFKITGAATGGTVALVATDSGSNTSLSFNAKGTGTISVGNVSTGDMIFGGTASATRRVDITTNGLATFAYGDNSLTSNITLQNLDTSSTTNHGSSILWRTCTNSSATAINSGRIAVIKEQLWTSTASTQDSAMAFYVTVDGSMSERVRISSGGIVTVGTTDVTATTGAGVKLVNAESGVANRARLSIVTAESTSSYTGLSLYSTGAGAYRFYVDDDGSGYITNTTWNAISDARLKENVRDIPYGLNEIAVIKPRMYDWKPGKGQDKKDCIGFIAQELQQIFPDFVKESKDVDENGVPYLTVGAADLIPVLVKAIQQLNTRLTSLEAL